MFESNGKKELKNKYNKIQGIAGPDGSRGSVYGELKLSEKLMEILNDVREEAEGLKIQLESAIYEKDKYFVQV